MGSGYINLVKKHRKKKTRKLPCHLTGAQEAPEEVIASHLGGQRCWEDSNRTEALQVEVWFRFALLLIYRDLSSELTLSLHTSSFWKASISYFFKVRNINANNTHTHTFKKKKTIGWTLILQTKTATGSWKAGWDCCHPGKWKHRCCGWFIGFK